MALRDGLWVEVTPSEHPHERAALNFLRERLPDREPFRAWSNFTFQAEDGRRYEVDLLVVTPTEVFLVEIKSHPNRMDGDAGSWTWTRPDGSRQTFDNPLRLAESKAKKLKSLLLHQDALRDPRLTNRRGPDGKPMRPGFYVRAVVFLSDPSLKVGLDDLGRTDVFGPDPDASEPTNDLPGIIARLTDVPANARNRIDRPLSAAIAKAVDQAGVRQSQALRQAGHYRLDELVADGDGWQDFIAQQPLTKDQRRIRLYLTSRAQTEEERYALARAAEREYRFLQGIDHPGIEKPLEVLPNPQGPALVFPHDPKAQRLDHYLSEHADELDLYERIELVRQLAETLRAAHRAGLYHRALAPQHVTVTPSKQGPKLKIRDWQAAARELTATAMSATSQPASGTSHVARLVSEQAHLYVAPEVIRLGEGQGQPRAADMWSLGAVSYLILTGEPPASDLDGLYATLKEHDSLTLAAGMDAPDPALDEVVRYATRGIATDRFVSVDEFLEYLDLALESLTTEPEADPIDAKRGDEIGDWKVLKRFGVGSTAVVLLAGRDGRAEVLKIARDEEHADRLRDEAEVLAQLEQVRSPTLVASYGIEPLAGRTALRLEAAQTTLSRLLEQEGPLSIDRLERFGQDLLDALTVLEQEGIAHRDIKPDNLGVIERGKNKERHLVLFDFSLTRADATNLQAGTAAYLDPFLSERDARRWDLQAERYAAAVTLHEMATGQRPEWGDGSTDPVLTDLTVPTLAVDVVDPSIRGPLTSFLERALNRDPARRFDTATDMRQAFDQLFVEVDVPATVSDDGLDPADVEVAGVTAATVLTDLGLAPRIVNVLERLGTVTAGDLATIPPHELSRLSGVGAAVRRDVAHLAERLRRELDDVEAADGGDVPSVDRLIAGLVPKPPADEDHRTAIRAFLGLVPTPAADWPSQRQVAEQADLERAVVADALGSARNRWRNRPELTAIRAELVDLLRTRDGVAGGDELAVALLATRGSLEEEPERTRRARAVIRAALEAEAGLQTPRFVHRRIDETLLVALDGPVRADDEVVDHDADALFDLAAELGEIADQLAADQPLPSPDRVVAALRDVPLPDPAVPMTDARLVRLAAAASRTAAVSSRLELYPIGLDPVRAVAEARGALLARGGLEAKDIKARVAARFPRAADLPNRPDLDRILDQASTGLIWHATTDGTPGRYTHPDRGGVLATSMFPSTGSSTTYASPDERDLARQEVDERLERLTRDGGFLALTVARRDLDNAATAITRRSDAVHVDLDRWLIEEMRHASEAANARWDRFLEADVDPDGATFRHVRALVSRALPAVIDRLTSHAPMIVATGLGLLVRYGELARLEQLRDQLTVRRHDGTLQALIVLVPGIDPGAMPTLDGHPIPVTTANQWVHLPSAWLNDTGAAA